MIREGTKVRIVAVGTIDPALVGQVGVVGSIHPDVNKTGGVPWRYVTIDFIPPVLGTGGPIWFQTGMCEPDFKESPLNYDVLEVVKHGVEYMVELL